MPTPTKPADFPITTIPELIEERAEEYGDKPLVVENSTGDTLTYREADERSDEVAAALAETGIGKGDLVATLMINSLDHIAIWLGCMKRGAVWCAINAEYKHDDLRRALEDLNPEMLVIDSWLLENYESVRDDVDVSHEFVRGAELDGAGQVEEILESEARPPEVNIEPDDPAVVLFTGGTTGKPKPVLNPQFASVAGAMRYAESWNPRSDDKHLTLGQMFHIAGQQYGVVGPMYSGITSVIVMRFSASEYWEWVNNHEATLIDAGGDVQDAILHAHDEPVENTARKSLAVGPTETNLRFQEMFDVELLEAWSLTEVGGVNLTNQPFEPGDEDGKPVGTSGKWAEIGIFDKEGGQLDPGPDNVGEIHVRPKISHTIMKGYYNNPSATVDTWQNLWLSTGDLGWKDEEGTLYFVGRQVHHLRRMGENFSAQEVESTINQHPKVAESGVVGIPNETISGDDPMAFVVLADNDTVDAAELVGWCEERLADFKVPRYIEFIDELPRGETKQQVQRHKLAERDHSKAWDREA